MTATPAGGSTPPEDPTRTIDLDAARAARREQRLKDGRGGRPEVKVNGKSYPLPAELPAETIHAFGVLFTLDAEELKDVEDPMKLAPALKVLGDGMEALFGSSWDAIHDDAKEAGDPLSFEDEIFLLEQAMDLYGWSLPESPASGSS